eukprot:CAMPEP_0197184258 /NCGR_PEP_ID=MMETSP1423-20130617/9542_1 /TAXON_ID=476441 /ORGANISM="Pseudo-nitzschia heimii, Strain UNC1101" /LENGTH=762 /DNA_ID=CAMNT_0042635035 /DNA_START=397 /DNA_END=2682 /DNA_ORIENTATION=+
MGSLRPVPPVSSKAKDYKPRPDEVVDELDELRTRGIAKVLNKHFNTTTRQLAIEKAEADSALADLERRRAQTKTFVPSKGGELNPYDKLYVQLQQKRAECRRKEKETMMLYQRYVMKYGKSAKAEPLVSTTSSPSSNETLEGGKDSNKNDLNGDLPGKSALGTLDENSETTFSKFYEKQQRENQEKELRRKKENEKSTQHFMSALNKFMTVSEDENDEHQAYGIHELVSSDVSQSPVVSKDKADPFMSAVSKFTAGKQQEVMGNNKSWLLTGQDGDIQSEPNSDILDENQPVLENEVSAVVTPDIKKTPSKDLPPADASDSVPEDESMFSQHEEDYHKEDLSPQKPFVGEEVENVRATPDVVPKAAAITLSPASDHSTPKSNKVFRVDVNGAAPYFHTTTVEGYDFDDRSIISELTSANSAVTRQVMDEVETEMEDFIKFEMEAIRKMLDSEEDASTVDNSVKSETSSLMLGDQSVHVAMKAEAMAREMQKILDDFAKEDAASVEDTKSILNESVQSSEHRNESSEPTNVYPYKFEPAIPGEDWYVHFDDNYQKEYYVEKNSNLTQWDYPQNILSPRKEQEAVSSDDFLSDMVSVASSRRSLSRRSSRRALYRKQRKRRRARRLMMSFLALLCVLVTVFYWRIHHSDESIAGSLTAIIASLKTSSYKEMMNDIVDKIEYSLTDRKKMEDLILQQQEALANIERDRKARELAEQRAKEEAHRISMEEKEKAAKEEILALQQQQLESESDLLAKSESECIKRNW